jgi:hypothetical protein
MTNEKCNERTENEKGRALLTSLALSFYRFSRIS